MKNGKRGFSVKFTPKAVLYPILWAASLVFTQLLRNKVSNAFFWFVCIFPLISVIYTLIGRASVQTYVSSDTVRSEKNTPVKYEIRLINSSPIPLSKVEAEITEPQSDGVRCRKKKLFATLVSFGACVIENTVSFPYRGSYDVGVERVWVYSPLGAFALRNEAANYAHVTVFPRKMPIERDFAKDASDDTSPSSERKATSDFSEPSDVKDYVPGDPIKSIQWKLSSKSQEIKVRKYESAEQKKTYIFCDVAASDKLPENTNSALYDSMKKLLKAESAEDTRKIRTLKNRVAALAENAEKRENVEKKKDKKNPFSGIIGYFKMKKVEDNYKKNRKKGMTEEQAQTVRTVDILIAQSSKESKFQSGRKEKKESKVLSDTAKVEAELEKEKALLRKKEAEEKEALDKIIKSAEEKTAALTENEKLFGGRVKAEYAADYDELCADSAVELTVAVSLSELLAGNSVCVVWFDSREDSGIAVYEAQSPDEFEAIYLKLSSAPVAPAENKVAYLAAPLGDMTSAKIKIVTPNLDPVSIGEIELVPAKFGGAGSGCDAEVLLVSHIERYADPAARAAFATDVENRLRAKGFSCNIWAESGQRHSASVFTPV